MRTKLPFVSQSKTAGTALKQTFQLPIDAALHRGKFDVYAHRRKQSDRGFAGESTKAWKCPNCIIPKNGVSCGDYK